MSTKIHIVMAADAGYQKGLEVAKASMIASCSEPERLEFHLYEEDPVLSKRILREFGTYKGSPMTFLRLYLGELLPDVDWVIWSNVDTLWYRDVIELASLFDESKTIQWVKDADWAADELAEWCKANSVPMGSFDVARYACAGVCILNLRRWRESYVLERCAEFAAKYGCPRFMEQDMLNILLASESGMLPSCWDVLIPKPEDSFNCVLHIIDVGRCFKRPYHGKVVEYLWWEHEARMTEFRKPWSLPFFVRRWMVRLILPFADKYFCDRIYRRFAWRWFLRRFCVRRGMCCFR